MPELQKKKKKKKINSDFELTNVYEIAISSTLDQFF